MTQGVKVTLAVVGGLVVLSGLCCLGTVATGLVAGVALGGAPQASGGAQAAPTGTGFGFSPPASFAQRGAAWRRAAGSETIDFVEVSRLPAVEGLDVPEQKLAALWARHVVPAFKPLPIHDRIPTPMVQRRFVQNGARAHFMRARLVRPQNDDGAFVTIYAVEADDRLEPLLVVQGRDGSTLGINDAFGTTHAWIEELLQGVTGSPTGQPLVSDEEVVGFFKSGSTSTAQWVNTMTGATGMRGAALAVEYHFEDDHSFTSRSAAGAGEMGAMKFGVQEDQGTWEVKHDVLVVDGEQFDQQYLITGATRGPEGRWLLVLQPRPHWNFAPETPFDVYERQD